MSQQAEIGVTGLAVMGRNLARNFARHGHVVAIHNRTFAKTQALLDEAGDEGTFLASESLEDFVASLARPRKVIIMVKAGPGTDAVIDELVPLLEEGDIVVDAGNAHFPDTIRREQALAEHGLHFVGSGVSGGEEGALNGPSIMPGGSRKSYESLGPLLEDISAKVDGTPVLHLHRPRRRRPLRQDGAQRHRVRRHAADRRGVRPDPARHRQEPGRDRRHLHRVEHRRARVVPHRDHRRGARARPTTRTGKALVDVVLDQAEQKGTGRWTVQNALDLGVPITGIAEATFARALSGSVPQREAARGVLPAGTVEWQRPTSQDADAFVEDVRRALYASKVVAYSQGFDQIAAASTEYGWDIDRGAMARIWRGGCIIRARFLNRITEAYERDAAAPAAHRRRLLRRRHRRVPRGVAPGGRGCGAERHPDAGVLLLARLLRRRAGRPAARRR